MTIFMNDNKYSVDAINIFYLHFEVMMYELMYRGNCFDILMFREILGNK